MNDISQHTVAGDSFRLLAACFYEPEKELFVEQKLCENLASLLEYFSPQAATDALQMATQLQEAEDTALNVDYSALFLGPFELQAPPYGSVYLENKREVMGETTMKTLTFYQDAGVEVSESEPADHIAIELEFMAFLHGREAAMLEEGMAEAAHRLQDLRKRFFTECLEPWMADFRAKIHEGTKSSFYRTLADCLSRFVDAYSQRMGNA